MKVVSPVFENRGRRESYLLALSVVLIFAFCTLIAYTAFASTEAEPPALKRGIICNANFYASGFLGIKKEIASHEVRIEADPESLSLTDGDKMLQTLATAKGYSNLRYGQYPQAKVMTLTCPIKEGAIRIEIEKN